MEQKAYKEVVEVVLKEQEKSVKAYLSGKEKVKENLFVFLCKQKAKKFDHNADPDLIKNALKKALDQIQLNANVDFINDTFNVSRVYRYRCKCDCTFGGDYHREGDIITSEEKLEVPHFEPVEEIKE